MINSFLRFKTKNVDNKPLRIKDIEKAKKVLFSLFTRYGDTIIDLVVIKEFIVKHPDKQYLVLSPRQMQPYVQELLPNIKCISLNKRNLLDMFKINHKLKKWQADIGFNPWSNGLDSCYFLTYCKKFLCYKNFNKSKTINHYQVVRRYLQLPEKKWKINKLVLKKDYKKVLICPQSTDENRSISSAYLGKIIIKLNRDYNNPIITIAAMDRIYFKDKCKQFIFKKTAQSSQNFIDLVKNSDLVICSDSAPLHIASALNKDLIACFDVTIPDIVINTGAYLKVN